MMNQSNPMNIRQLLKTFGIQADEAVMAYLSQNTSIDTVTLRLTLEDITDYGEDEPARRLIVQVESDISA
jgi:hypothetical protein